jgi:hypothetical protein
VTDPPGDPIALAIHLGAILDSLGIRYTLGGSIASSVAGEPRSTIDLDVVIALDESQASALVEALDEEFYVDETALLRAIQSRTSTNLIQQTTQLKVDLFIAGGTPLDEQQLRRRQAVTIRPGQTIYVHPAEDILLQKLHWFRKGGEISDRQWRDILGIVRVQGRRLDRAYLRLNAPVLEVADLLERALRDFDPGVQTD